MITTKTRRMHTIVVVLGLLLSAWYRPASPARAAANDAARVRSLDGRWQIVFDPQNEGRQGRWHMRQAFETHPDRREIIVPSCWELIEKDYEGVAFYRRTFTVPAGWESKVIRLQFDAVNFLAEVWLNDQAVGTHEGGFTPFEFRVDGLLRPGQQNVLIVRVAGPILLQDKRVEGVGPMETPQWRGAVTGGIWQSVRLIATNAAYVDDVFIEPNIADSTATVHMDVTYTGRRRVKAGLAVAVRAAGLPDTPIATVNEPWELKPGRNTRTIKVPLPGAVHWSPENPHLYRLEATIACDGRASDRWSCRFGMRQFTIAGGRFCLNGRPMYLKATFFEGLYPTRLAYPDSRDMATREIQLAKEAGFNMIRPWRKPPPPMWLDLCDELGVLTVGSLAIECMDMPVESARLPGWVENEVRQSILRDRNRTCVVQWELFNELKRPVLKQLLHPMSVLARQLDPTRLILDESGGWAQGANMFLPYEFEPTKFNDIHHYPGPQINADAYEKLILTGSKTHEQMRRMGLTGRMPGRNVVPNLMTFFSELGYGSLPDLVDNNKRFADLGNPLAPPTIYHRRLADQHTRALMESGFDRIYPDLKQFCLDQQKIHGAANKRMIEAVRSNPLVIGYCIHALTAGDWIIGAGLLDLFRNPKTYAYEGTRAANQPRILPIRMHPRNVYAARGTTVEITGVNEHEAATGVLNVTILSEAGQTVFAVKDDVTLNAAISELFKHNLDTRNFRGAYTVRAQLTTDDGSLLAANEYEFDVFSNEQLAAGKARLAVIDPDNRLKPFLSDSGIAFVDFNAGTDRSLPVFVARTEAKTDAERRRFEQLKAFIHAGGRAVYLQAGGQKAPWSLAAPASDLLPVKARIKASIGLWLCISHIVHDHPIFDGLPVNTMMGSTYENVWAEHTLLDIPGRPIAASVGFDFAPDFDLSKRHYYGPGDTWWGSDLAVVPHGAGYCLLSQLRLVDNLGKDPVADRILLNMIQWVSENKTAPDK